MPLRFTGRGDRILALAEQFRKLHRRRLVIVGGPGAGKTTLAVQLVLQLLADWQPGEPVPVLLSLASWDPHTRPRLQDWLAAQLNQTYPDLRAFGTNTAQRLAEQGWLLPVLDGLDEIPAQRRGEVIEALNASLHPDTGLIMTSRTTEYTETVRARDVLTAAAVIEPEPLTAREAARYLKDRLPRQPDESWQAVLTALRDGTAGALAEVVASPLGLWLLGTVHIDGHRDPRPLINPDRYRDAAAIQHHLLNELIPAVVHSRLPLSSGQESLRSQRHHNPDQVQRWLTALAIELRNAQTSDWRWWQLARHTFTTPGLVFGLVVGLVGVLVVGLASVSVIVLVGRLGGLASGLVVGLSALFGLVGGLAAVYSDVPGHTDLQIRGRIKTLGSKLASGLLVGLVGGLAFGLASGLVGGFASGLVDWLAFGLVFGVMGGLISFAASPSIARRTSSPEESLRGDRQLSLLITGMFMLVFVVFGLFGLLGLFELVSGLVGGFVGGLLVGLMRGPVMPPTCWPAFVVTSLWLAVLRRMPFGLMNFLDEAYRLGLLRVVGPVYQFRHATLQDHLAPLAEARLATTANS
ncbi:MAG: NACHT domain-containing protein [Pseudonocardiaceae bacterium]